jgi:hypothetical protein
MRVSRPPPDNHRTSAAIAAKLRHPGESPMGSAMIGFLLCLPALDPPEATPKGRY